MSTSFFDPSQWYRLSNDRTGVNRTLSLGYYPDSATPGAPGMTVAGSYSSENWQLFFQSGLYFIRNYDWGADWQLGVTANELSIPTMLQAGGLLGMQWNVTEWSDGTFKLTNMLLGSNTPVFGVGAGSTIPTMNENEQGAHWAMDINIMNGGEKITDVALLQTLSSIEVRILDYPIRHSFSFAFYERTTLLFPIRNPIPTLLGYTIPLLTPCRQLQKPLLKPPKQPYRHQTPQPPSQQPQPPAQHPAPNTKTSTHNPNPIPPPSPAAQ